MSNTEIVQALKTSEMINTFNEKLETFKYLRSERDLVKSFGDIKELVKFLRSKKANDLDPEEIAAAYVINEIEKQATRANKIPNFLDHDIVHELLGDLRAAAGGLETRTMKFRFKFYIAESKVTTFSYQILKRVERETEKRRAA
jgi:hypothetical protein